MRQPLLAVASSTLTDFWRWWTDVLDQGGNESRKLRDSPDRQYPRLVRYCSQQLKLLTIQVRPNAHRQDLDASSLGLVGLNNGLTTVIRATIRDYHHAVRHISTVSLAETAERNGR